MTDIQTEQPRNKGGRPKGRRDSYPRGTGNFQLLAKTTFGHIVDLVRLAPGGRELDKIALLRAAQIAILGHLTGEIAGEGIRRRASLVHAFEALHRAEIETIKLLPDMAHPINGPVPPGQGSPGNLVELHLPDFTRRPKDDED